MKVTASLVPGLPNFLVCLDRWRFAREPLISGIIAGLYSTRVERYQFVLKDERCSLLIVEDRCGGDDRRTAISSYPGEQV